jgi:diguanylate cyclase (GGDEF)-like protein
MLSCTTVTDVVSRSDELGVLRAALDKVQDGIILLDADLNAQFMNRAVRRLWGVSDEQAERRPPYVDLVTDARQTKAYGVPPDQLEPFLESRIALVRDGDPTPQDLRTRDGRSIRSQCAVLPNGGRILTYFDVTDLVNNAEMLQRLATTDSLTTLNNRRNFMVLAKAEWARFQRYQRPLSMLMIDIDHFKSINDNFGHATGDQVIVAVANIFKTGQRTSDIIGRLGGEEFGLLLPETEVSQAQVVAERIRAEVASRPLMTHHPDRLVTISIGAAAATVSMSGIDALMEASDKALYAAKSSGRNRVVRYQPPVEDEHRHAAE